MRATWSGSCCPMSGPGSAYAPDRVAAPALMALEYRALRQGGDAPSLAERPGTSATRRRGQGHEIREIRPWAEGDDPRHLDAAASARTGSPQIRSFHEDREASLFLIADFRRPMLWGTRGRLRSVAAAEALALAGWRAVHAGGAVGACALTEAGPLMQPPRPRHRGMALVAGCLDRAHRAAMQAAIADPGHLLAPRSLAPDLVRAARQVPRGAGILLATGLDDPGDGLDAALDALAARGPVQLLLVEDAFELSPPARPLAFEGAEGSTLADFTALPALRAARPDSLARPGLRVTRLASSEVAR